jgi:chromosome segregation protein
MSTKLSLENNDELDNITFETQPELQEEQNIKKNTTKKKYIKIDGLENDKTILGHKKNVIVSMISPDNILNCGTWGIKIRGFEDDDKKTEDKAEIIRKMDKYFDVFVGLNGHWHPMNPTTTQIESEKYKNKDLNKIMKNIHESEKKDLREKLKKDEQKQIENENQEIEEERILNELYSRNDDGNEEDEELWNENFLYSKEDCLDEDRIIQDQRFAIISFASPELLNNIKDYYFKIRGYTYNYQKALQLAKMIQESDNLFNVSVIEIGKWAPINFKLMSKMKNYDESKQTEKMKTEMMNLNEIIGRYKKRLEDRKEILKKRKIEQIKECARELDEENNNVENSDEEINMENNSTKKVELSQDLGKRDATKERLRRMIENNDKLKGKLDNTSSTNTGTNIQENKDDSNKNANEKTVKKDNLYIQNLNRNKFATMERIKRKIEEKKMNESNLGDKKIRVKQEELRLNEKRQNVQELKENKEKIEENLQRMRDMLANRNQKKE